MLLNQFASVAINMHSIEKLKIYLVFAEGNAASAA